VDKLEACIAILDDDKDVLLSAKLYLQKYFAKVIALNNPIELMPAIHQHHPQVILLDMNYHRGENDGVEGLQLLKEIKSNTTCEVVMMTAYGEVETAVKAIKLGALDFVTKPWKNEKLLATMMAALKVNQQNRELIKLKTTEEARNLSEDQEVALIGVSEALNQVNELIEQVAATDANVLILGENGTGKDITARLIHQRSERKNKAFVKVDLGAVHENLFESELFGAKKGAYTDLTHDKIGRFQLADRGSLFLDEIGNLSLPMQAKLLSVLQNKTIVPVGSTKELETDIRLISATNVDLHQAIESKEFRQDLLYRINTIEIHMPPLRERPEDIKPLFDYFLERFCTKYRKRIKPLNTADLQKLMRYTWPGNIRELEHAVERAVIMSKSSELNVEGIIPDHIPSKNKYKSTKLEEVEKAHVLSMIEKNNGNISKAAQELGLTRAALYRRIEKFRL